MRLIDADAFIEFLKETSKKLEFDKIEFKDSTLTAQAIIDGVIADLDGTSLDGFENAPTIEPERKAKVIENKYHIGTSLNIVGEPKICHEYLCGACKKKVLGGDKYFSHCGAKLEWREDE